MCGEIIHNNNYHRRGFQPEKGFGITVSLSLRRVCGMFFLFCVFFFLPTHNYVTCATRDVISLAFVGAPCVIIIIFFFLRRDESETWICASANDWLLLYYRTVPISPDLLSCFIFFIFVNRRTGIIFLPALPTKHVFQTTQSAVLLLRYDYTYLVSNINL